MTDLIGSALRDLQERKLLLESAIAAMERLQQPGTVPPLRLKRGRKSMSPEERAQVSRRMREFWASKKGTK